MRRALALVVFVVFIAVHIANIYPQGYLKTPVYRNQPVGISKTRVGRLGRKLRDCIRRDTFTHATIISPDGSEEPRARLELGIKRYSAATLSISFRKAANSRLWCYFGFQKAGRALRFESTARRM
eukprot:1395432-Amorphochlora_amoeboformis.AAC.1